MLSMRKYLENENEAVLNNEMITEYVDEYKEETGEYPEYYAGTYVNDDGNLVVCVTDDSWHMYIMEKGRHQKFN